MSRLNKGENTLYGNTTMTDIPAIDCREPRGEFQLFDTTIERSFTILPNINHMDKLHEDVIAIWLDDTIGTLIESQWFNIARRLRQIISHVQIFTNANECIDYVCSIGIEKIFLIVAGTYGDDFDTRLFEKIMHEVSIYVLTSSKLGYNGKYTSIRGCFDTTNTLVDQIYDDYMVYVTETASDINFIRINTNGSTTRCINPQLVQWKCCQLMLDILRRMPCPREQSKQRLIQFCRCRYRDNPAELARLSEFERCYESNSAINWYTRESFLYRLLNQSFRTNNIDAKMDLSYALLDINDQLHEFHCQQRVQTTSPVVAYRGQFIGIDEFQKLKLNVGGFISNNTLLSTTPVYDIARVYHGEVDMTDHVRVMIEIAYDLNSFASKPIANVSSISVYQDEEEVLFMCGNIFRIDSCQPTSDNIWVIQLTVCDDSHPVVDNSSDYFDVAMLQLLEILPKISPMTSKANDRMLQWCRLYYKDDRIELAKIDQFEDNYRSDSAIRWYSKDSFLYRLINIALRHEDIDMIIDFRCFIIDLYEQLTKSHIDYVSSFKEQSLTVYRGQKISLLELRRLKHNTGNYISIKSLFSASLSSDVALIYANLNESDRKQFLQSVLFQIDIDMGKLPQSCKNNIFANIMNISYYVHDEEVLFMANTRFRVQSVTKWTDTLWVVCLNLLSLDDENDDEMKIMKQHLEYLTNMITQHCGDSIWSLFKK